MSGQELLIEADGVSKKFTQSLRRSMALGLVDLSRSFFGLSRRTDMLRPGEFWGLDNVSFTLRRGETLGLIGPNGSGKTTLLRILSGILPLDKGRVTVKGRMGVMISIGAGFHPHMTGRENIYLKGAIYGMSKKEIDRKIDDIVDFAEIGDFIHAPVATYSSGMVVRLGFAISTAIAPDILLLDEILAVGDVKFRNKCYERLGRMKNRAATIFVSHSMEQVSQICDTCLLLGRGRVIHYGDVEEGVNRYNESMFEVGNSERIAFFRLLDPVESAELNWSSEELAMGDDLELITHIHSRRDTGNLSLRVLFYDQVNQVVGEWNSRRVERIITLAKGENELRVSIGPIQFKPGVYKIGVGLYDEGGVLEIIRSHQEKSIRVLGPIYGNGIWQFGHR